MSENPHQNGERSADREPGSREKIDAIVAAEREIRSLQARQLRRIAQYASHSSTPETRRDDFRADELALALGLTVGAARNLIEFALTASRELPATLSRLEAGELDLRRVQVLADVTKPLEPAARGQVERYVLAKADGGNATEIRQIANRAVHRFDTDGAERRHSVRRLERRVEMWPREDGMAELRAYLTAAEATVIKLRLDTFAKTMGADDERTMDQRRADTLRDLLLSRAAGQVTTHVHVTVPAGLLADNDTAARPSQQAAGVGDAEAGNENTGAAGSRPGSGAGWWVAGPGCAELAGYGTIAASQARDLAAGTDATWNRLLTDPSTGSLLEYGRTTYRPPAGLADFVRARDRRCVFPGCTRPSTECDLDHRAPWPTGPTNAENLAPLCRRHHRLKHESRWRVTKRPDGHYVWTSPAEIEYVRKPDRIVDPDPPPEFVSWVGVVADDPRF
jgi:Domain of unknown function (DUF222)